jgi:hypothetical protein
MNRAHLILVTPMLCLLWGGCDGSWTSPRREVGSAVWVIDQETPITGRDMMYLGRANCGEVFLEVGELRWEAGTPEIRALTPADLPRRTTATLVIRGSWTAGEELDEMETAQRLGGELRQLRNLAESRGLFLVGFHFDVTVPGRRALEGYARLLARLRDEIDRPLLLSATVASGWLEWEEMEGLAEAVHFLACFVYGQRPGAPERPDFWDFDVVESRLRRLEAWGRDYLVGVNTLATLDRRRRNGEVVASTSAFSVTELFSRLDLKLSLSFPWEAYHRDMFDLEATRSMRVGDWTLRAGDVLHVIRPTTSNLEELKRMLEGLDLDHRRGELYYRLPLAGEQLSLSALNIVSSLAATPATPELVLELDTEGFSARRWLVRVELQNHSPEATGIAMTDFNYVELKARRGIFGPVDLGDFTRMVLGKSGPDGLAEQTFRNADLLRLYYPLVPPGVTVRTGPVELKLRAGEPELRTEARYMLPDGRTLLVPSRVWTPEESR